METAIVWCSQRRLIVSGKGGGTGMEQRIVVLVPAVQRKDILKTACCSGASARVKTA